MSEDDNGSIASSRAEDSPIPSASEEVSEPSRQENAEQTPPTRHSVYYFDPVVFRVEGILFKVPKYGFMVPGSMFYDMFSLPIPEGEEAEGSESNPINPPSVTQQEFFGFLFVIYPFLGSAAHHEINYDELVGALKLATMWQFPKIRGTAIYLLSPLLASRNPVENVLLGRQYRSKNILRQGYLTMIDENITVKDLRSPHELDWETISGIFAAKTHLMERNLAPSVQCPKCSTKFTHSCHDHHEPGTQISISHSTEPEATIVPGRSLVEEYVDSMFRDELDEMHHDSEIDADDIKRTFGTYLSRPKNDDQMVHQAEVSPGARDRQEIQTSSNPGVDHPHHIYYIETTLISVERTLFRLPKADILPIFDHIPPDISARSFHWFLSALYLIDECNLVEYDQWLVILRLSTLWGFTEVRQKAIKKLSPIMKDRNPAETVLTARKYRVKAWMFCALEELANRTPGLTMVQELREPFALDWETIAKLLSIQCQFDSRAHRPNACCNNCNDLRTGKKKKVTCSHTCNKLNLPVDDQAYQSYYQSRDSGSTECSSKDTIREMVRRELGEETMTWP